MVPISEDRVGQAEFQAETLATQPGADVCECVYVVDAATQEDRERCRKLLQMRLPRSVLSVRILTLAGVSPLFRSNHARNLGIRQSRGRLIAIADVDFGFHEAFIHELIAADIDHGEIVTYPSYFCTQQAFEDERGTSLPAPVALRQVAERILAQVPDVLEERTNGNLSNQYNRPTQRFRHRGGREPFVPIVESEFFPIATGATFSAVEMFDDRFYGRYFNRLEFCDRIRVLAEQHLLRLSIVTGTFAAHRPHTIVLETNMGRRPENRAMRFDTLREFGPGERRFERARAALEALARSSDPYRETS